MKYIISEYRRDLKRTYYVCARPGYYRGSDGQQKRDGCFAGGPEWSTNRDWALEFTNRLSAARVLGKCPSATLVGIE